MLRSIYVALTLQYGVRCTYAVDSTTTLQAGEDQYPIDRTMTTAMLYPTLYTNTCERQTDDPNLWNPSVFKTTGQKEKKSERM